MGFGRTLWIGDLQYWMDENYLYTCFAHTDEVTTVKVTCCKHEYHMHCILEWSQRSKECPICWQSLALKDPARKSIVHLGFQNGGLRFMCFLPQVWDYTSFGYVIYDARDVNKDFLGFQKSNTTVMNVASVVVAVLYYPLFVAFNDSIGELAGKSGHSLEIQVVRIVNSLRWKKIMSGLWIALPPILMGLFQSWIQVGAGLRVGCKLFVWMVVHQLTILIRDMEQGLTVG
ncbi:uncharacterized protein LOC130733787 [Lotus japonicus]|uniref:uncharacterized protein LOC130733787 n=1 Tax=Lotus japonicus TaxID=34305 RepID=UPI002583AA6C|nr:uncharacterized protein LOC130733787 [Lotus japonicus]